jgi:archaemetzincin
VKGLRIRERVAERLGVSASSGNGTGVRTIQLMAIGPQLDPDLLLNLRENLFDIFNAPCQILEESVDPAAAFSTSRGQYHSTAILAQLAAIPHSGTTRLLGVTELDLFVPVLTYVFGEGQVEGHCAVVSLARLKESFYGLPDRLDLLRERLLKEAVHELGHTHGLRHCQDWECVMASTHAVERLDLKTPRFCDACRAVVRKR